MCRWQVPADNTASRFGRSWSWRYFVLVIYRNLTLTRRTLRRVRVSTVAAEKTISITYPECVCVCVCVCVCSLKYPAYSAHAPYCHLCAHAPYCHLCAHASYCHLWTLRLYHIFPHYLINGTIFEIMLLNIKCVFWFSLQLLSEIFLVLRRSERDMIISVYWSSCRQPVILIRF
jgi:hypothetical protein